MAQLSTLLELRGKIKERKPTFIRQDNPKRMKLNYKWRKPKGIHSKIRHKFKGRRKMPSPGYKSPRRVKGLHSSGLEMISVYSINGLTKIKNDSQGAVIPKSIGAKKRLEILKKAKELNVTILNLNVDEQIKKIVDLINSRKKKDAKEKKTESKEEKAKEIMEETEKPTEENKKGSKKEAEKKEKDKLLTKRV